METALKLKELRKQKKLKQSELASVMGVAKNTISTWETGSREPNCEYLRKLAFYFDVTVDYFIGKGENTRDFSRVMNRRNQ